MVLLAVKQSFKALQHAVGTALDDEEIVFEAVRQHGWSLRYASERLRNDYEFCLKCVKADGMALEFVPEALHDTQLVREAIREAPLPLRATLL